MISFPFDVLDIPAFGPVIRSLEELEAAMAAVEHLVSSGSEESWDISDDELTAILNSGGYQVST